MVMRDMMFSLKLGGEPAVGVDLFAVDGVFGLVVLGSLAGLLGAKSRLNGRVDLVTDDEQGYLATCVVLEGDAVVFCHFVLRLLMYVM